MTLGVRNEDILTRWRGATEPTLRRFQAGDLALPGDGGRATLARLVGDVESFARDHWGRRPLLRRRAELPRGEERFADLFSLAALDEVMSAGWLRSPAFRLVQLEGHGKRQFTPSQYTTARMYGSDRIEDAVDAGRLLSEIHNGATLQLLRLDEMWPSLGCLCREVEQALTHPVEAYIFVTPPSAQALATHYDEYDVFVLQFTGRKEWSVFEPPVPYPLERGAVEGDPGPACVSAVLEPGDCLYVPRGFPHSATALDAISGHVTLSADTTTWLNVFERLFELALAELREDETFREPLPVGFAGADDGLEARVAERLKRAIEALDEEQAAEAVQRTKRALWARRRPLLGGLLDQIARIDELAPDTRIGRRPGSVALVTRDGDRLELELGDRELLMPTELEPTLRWILAQDEFTLEDLPQLDPTSGHILISRLILAGLLEAEPRPDNGEQS